MWVDVDEREVELPFIMIPLGASCDFICVCSEFADSL